MPLIEEQRDVFVDDFADNVDFFYEGFDPQVEVYRWGEGFSQEHPYILVKFLPTSRKKFQSLSDVVGRAKGRFYQYGLCHLESITVTVYCNEFHESDDGERIVNGRKLCSFIAEKCLERVLKVWEDILKGFNASFDRKANIPIIRDLSMYDKETGTKLYNYEFDMMLRTQLRWNKVPDDYDESDDIAERAILHVDPNGEIDKRKTIIINTN